MIKVITTTANTPKVKPDLLTIILCFCIMMITVGCSGSSSDDGSSESNSSPLLTSMAVGGNTKPLNPGFSPDIFRYSLVADEEGSDLTITTNSDDSYIVEVLNTVSPNDTPFDLSNVSAGDEIEITVTDTDGQKTNYEIVYLPSDFPDVTVTTLTENVGEGSLYVGFKQRSTDYTANYIANLNNHGVPNYYKRLDRNTNNFTKHANGSLSYSVGTDDDSLVTDLGRRPFEHIILDADYNETDRIKTVGLQHTDFHEFIIQENGNPILLAYEPSKRDLTPYGGEVNGDVEDSVIQELDAVTGDVLFEWNSWGHVKYEDELRGANYDYAHINSIAVDDDGNYIFVARGTSQISKIDRSTGNLLWTLGGKSNEFTFVNDPFENLCGPHTATILENGNMLVFDNGQYCWPENPERGELTRVVEYSIDETNKVAELVWSYTKEGAYSLSGGSAQRLANGNTLICWNRGPDELLTEVDAMGNIVFELEASYAGVPVNSYRGLRFED